MPVIDFVVSILSTPAILVGLIALLGLLLQKAPLEKVITGTLKTIVGFLVLGAGASFVQTGSLLAFGEVFNYAFHMQGVVTNTDAFAAIALKDFGQATALIMSVGMLMNIVLARFSNLKFIFLTGHSALYMSAMFAVFLSGVGHLSGWQLVVAGGALMGLYMALAPAICEPTMKKVTGTDAVALAHTSSVAYWAAGAIGSLFAKKDEKVKSTEDINFSQALSFLRDTTVAIGLTMVLFFVVVTGIAVAQGLLNEDPSQFQNLNELLNVGTDTQTNWIVWSIKSGLAFAGGVYVILAGVRMVIGEITPAFKGIADKLVPGAKPALDCPVTFAYAPNAVIIGFLCSFAGGIVALLVLGLIDATMIPVALILPGVVPHFFCGATAGVFGNARGGIKGCVAGSFVNGLLGGFLPAACMPVLTAQGFSNLTFGDADFGTIGILLNGVMGFLQGPGLLVLCIVLALLPIIIARFVPSKAQAE